MCVFVCGGGGLNSEKSKKGLRLGFKAKDRTRFRLS